VADNEARDQRRRVAVVTGGGRGIGAATARALAAAGHAVLLAARTTSELRATADAIAATGAEAIWQVCDVAREEQVAALFATADARWGRVDTLVNCAGVVRVAPFPELAPATWDAVLGVNLRGTYLCCREAFRRMAASGGGVIVNFSSLSGVRGPEKFPGLAAYNVSKYGVLGLTEILAVEGRPHGIRVIAVSPGAVNTRMLQEAAPHLRARVDPEGVARIVEFLASDAAEPLSGANLELFTNA
jgi:NAD(P)-dependent dehydrogenase (short-subunit alcohol dehydrogenase family)